VFFEKLPEARLSVSVGQYSDKGRKPVNQDFYGWRAPEEPLLGSRSPTASARAR
jgi:hypothetical protein